MGVLRLTAKAVTAPSVSSVVTTMGALKYLAEPMICAPVASSAVMVTGSVEAVPGTSASLTSTASAAMMPWSVTGMVAVCPTEMRAVTVLVESGLPPALRSL